MAPKVFKRIWKIWGIHSGLLYVILSPIIQKVHPLSHIQKAHKENVHTHFAVFSLYASGHKLEPILGNYAAKISNKNHIPGHLPRKDGFVEKTISSSFNIYSTLVSSLLRPLTKFSVNVSVLPYVITQRLNASRIVFFFVLFSLYMYVHQTFLHKPILTLFSHAGLLCFF